MSWEVDLARYREIHEEHRDLSARLGEAILTRPESDIELAELLGWKEETVARIRAPKPAKVKIVTRRELVLRQMTSAWEETESLIPRLATILDWQEASVKTLLRKLETDGLIESKGRDTTYMGKKGRIRTHFRKFPDVGY